MGMNLVTVANEQEHDDLFEYTVQYGRCMTNVTYPEGQFFIGLAREDSYAEWEWQYRNSAGQEVTCPTYKYGDTLNKWPSEDFLIDENCVYMKTGANATKEINWTQVRNC